MLSKRQQSRPPFNTVFRAWGNVLRGSPLYRGGYQKLNRRVRQYELVRANLEQLMKIQSSLKKEEEWYFSIVDVVGALTESPNPRKYWSMLKTRLKKEGNQLATNCSQLKMQSSDGKRYKTDVANTEQLLRIKTKSRGHGRV